MAAIGADIDIGTMEEQRLAPSLLDCSSGTRCKANQIITIDAHLATDATLAVANAGVTVALKIGAIAQMITTVA